MCLKYLLCNAVYCHLEHLKFLRLNILHTSPDVIKTLNSNFIILSSFHIVFLFVQIQQQMAKGVNPREILSDLGVENEQIPEYVDDVTIWKIIINMLAEPPRRNKLRHVNTLDDVVRLLKGKL